jgi:uncharacterized protein involved in exopolysaccharide biosynthesis
MTTEIQTKKQPDDEIDLIALGKTFWKGRSILIKSVIAFGLIGLFVAILSPKEYVAKTVMVPQVSDGQSKLGGLSGLAAMAGFNLNLGSTGSELSPTIYPQIVSSIPFQLELMNTPLNFSGSASPVTLYDYFAKESKTSFLGYLKKYTVGLPGKIISSVKGKTVEDVSIGSAPKQPIQLTEKQREVRDLLSKLVSLDVNAKDSYLSLSAKMEEAGPAAQLAQRAQELLQQYIIEFKIKKTKANLDFVQQRYDETAKEYNLAQQRLAAFRDRNRGLTSAVAGTDQEKLISQYNLISGVYTELAKQLEQARIQVKQDTPVFTIIEPVSVPTERSKPNRPMIFFIWIFLGGVVGTGIIFGKEYMTVMKKRWREI